VEDIKMRKQITALAALLLSFALVSCNSGDASGTSLSSTGEPKDIQSQQAEISEMPAEPSQGPDNAQARKTGINPNTDDPIASFLPLDNLSHDPIDPETFVWLPPSNNIYFEERRYYFDEESLKTLTNNGLSFYREYNVPFSEPVIATKVVLDNRGLFKGNQYSTAYFAEDNMTYVFVDNELYHTAEHSANWREAGKIDLLSDVMHAFGGTHIYYKTWDGKDKLDELYLGMQEYLGVKCWVFDFKGLKLGQRADQFQRIWVDPSNGLCLRMEMYGVQEPGDVAAVYTVTKYDMNLTEFPEELVPAYEPVNPDDIKEG